MTFSTLILHTELCVLHGPRAEDRKGEGRGLCVYHTGSNVERTGEVRPGLHE